MLNQRPGALPWGLHGRMMMSDEIHDQMDQSKPAASEDTGHAHSNLEAQLQSIAGQLEVKYARLEQKLSAMAAEWTAKAEAITRDAEKRMAALRSELQRVTAALKAKAAPAAKKPTAKKSAVKPAAKAKAAKKSKAVPSQG